MNRHLCASLLASAGIMALASAAQAQQAAPAASEEIVVTGSRVITNGNNSPTPVTVVPTQQMLQVQPTTVVDALNLMPALQGSQTTTSAAGGGQRNGAAAYINLRNMGDLRTLVLFDGHRVIPTINQNEGDTDTWVVPQMLIQRVDVVTGGVSAVYGSDAISGVVNFITDTKFNGIKLQASGGVSQYGDDQQADVGVALGRSLFGGRGHIEFSYEYHDDPGVTNRLSRAVYATNYGTGGLGTAASPYYVYPNNRASNYTYGGLFTNGAFAGQTFAANGVLSAFVPGAATGVTNAQSGGGGAWQYQVSLKAALIFHQVFARFDYDITDNIHGYLQIAGTSNHTDDEYQMPSVALSIQPGNPFLGGYTLPAKATLDKYIVDNPLADQHTNTYMAYGGLNGTVSNYKWDLGFQLSQSIIEAANMANVNYGRLYAAVDSKVVNGQIVCNAAQTNPTYAGCVPFNPFGPSAESAAALNYILQETWNKNRTSLGEVNGSFSGAPFSTWAGPVNMAVSGEYRDEAWDVSANASPNTYADCTGITVGCTQGTTKLWEFTTMPANPAATESVWEAAYETDIPLAKDLPFMQSFNINGAVRYTDYSISGSAVTWKIGGDWKVNDEWTLRATRSHDIRAPNLWELYSPTTYAPLTNFTDPYTHGSVNVTQSVESNTQLVPEQADTTTAGFVYRPAWLPRFSFTVDAYRIQVNNVIFQLQGQSASVLAGCDASGGTSQLCSLIARPLPYSNTTTANNLTALYSKYLNVATLDTYGADFEANYTTNLFGRPLGLRGLMSYQPHLVINQGPGGVVDLGDAYSGVNLWQAEPSIKYTLLADYKVTDRVDISLLERGFNGMKDASYSQTTPEVYFVKSTQPPISYTNINFAYTVPNSFGSSEFYFNIANLFNTFPTYNFTGGRDEYDPVGRDFMIGVRFRH
ncbi:MAG TPA: TonB-dependent receptor [Caulobacteraceae bacterium]|nr:TonB-dependent receptor [Caulobacteraceae bacterium]